MPYSVGDYLYEKPKPREGGSQWNYFEEQPLTGTVRDPFGGGESPETSRVALDLASSTLPKAGGVALGMPPAPAPVATKPDYSSALMGVSPVLASVGANLLRGRRGEETALSRTGDIIAGASRSMLLNENLRKMLSQYMAGQAGTPQGFPSDQQFGMSGLEAAGLTPEMVSHVYQTALKTRGEERKWPLERMGALADIHNKIVMGEYHEAQIPYMQAQLNKLRMETELMPARTRMEIMEKQATMQKIMADTRRLELEAKYKLPAEIEGMQARAEYERAGVPLRQQQAWEASPQGIAFKEFQGMVAKQYGHKPEVMMLGDRAIVLDPMTRKPLAEFKIGEKPGEGTKLAPAHITTIAKQFAMSEFIEEAGKDLLARYPGEEQKKAVEMFQDLRAMMKDPLAMDQAFPALRSALSEKNRKLFDQVYDAYKGTFESGGSATQASSMVDRIRSRGAAPALEVGEFSTNPAAKIPPSQMPKPGGAPILDSAEIGPAMMQKFQGRTKESGNPVKVSELKDFVFNEYASKKGISRKVSDAFVDKQFLQRK